MIEGVFGHSVAEVIDKGIHQVTDAADAVSAKAHEWTDAMGEVLAEKQNQIKEVLDMWIKNQIHTSIETIVDDVPRRLKDGVEDELMPGVVRRAKDKAIDGAWPDIRQEVMWEIAVMLDGDDEHYEQAVDDRGKPDCIRAFIRYHLAPYDKTIWANLKDPVYMIILILSCVPVYGIFAWTYLIIFFVIDKSDEYQLMYFILWFKGSQFFSWGVIKSIVGYITYFLCATFPTTIDLTTIVDKGGRAATHDHSSCEASGPGNSGAYLITIGSWIGMLVLAWAAALLLPMSKEKGRSELKGKLDHNAMEVDEKKKSSHGYIRSALIWDSVFFFLTIGLFFLIVLIQPETDVSSKLERSWSSNPGWQVVQTLYMCQVIYGWSSFVFVPFMLPGLQTVLTHAPPTAYDEYGRCRKFKGAPKPEAAEGESFKQKMLSRSQSSLDSMVGNIKTIAGGGSVDMDKMRQRFKNKRLGSFGGSFAGGEGHQEEVEAEAKVVGDEGKV